jgi:RNA polymerase sigma factor (sigma-70 family)
VNDPRQPALGPAPASQAGGPGDRDAPDADLLARFVGRREESAFAALLRRHGPMVLGVCRRLLRHSQDAEDAFQAVFLVLARKAAAVGRGGPLANWLYGVAHRVAARLRRGEARRRARERLDMDPASLAARGPALGADLALLLHEEVNRLPPKYRQPVVLCYLEGRTNEEAAAELRWPVGTVKGRLARARVLLHRRLTRRGVAVPAALIAAALVPEAAAPPPALLESTLEAALHFAAGSAAPGGVVSARALALSEGVVRSMRLNKLLAVLLVVVALGLGGGTLGVWLRAREPAAEKKADKPRTDREQIQGTWKVVSGKFNGQDPPDEEARRIKAATWEFTADKIIVKTGGEARESTYKLDPTAKPRQIDVAYPGKGAEKGETIPAIYSLEGDTLTICGPLPGSKERPTELASEPGGRTMLMVLKRVKPEK